jgi:hypothetical protein
VRGRPVQQHRRPGSSCPSIRNGAAHAPASEMAHTCSGASLSRQRARHARAWRMENQRLLQLPWALSTRCACGSWLTAAGPEPFFLFFFGILQSGAAASNQGSRLNRQFEIPPTPAACCAQRMAAGMTTCGRAFCSAQLCSRRPGARPRGNPGPQRPHFAELTSLRQGSSVLST